MKYITGFVLLFSISCTREINKQTEYSFYYWKTTFSNEIKAADFIQSQRVNHFYIHYFDIDWDPNLYQPVPVAEMNGFINSVPFTSVHFTPVIYITNNCLDMMDNHWCDSLPNKIRNKIIFITNRLQQANPSVKTGIDEIQIDCDWTERTKEKYFRFLKNFKQRYPDKIISATVRLYPYKYYEKAGVPPVDKGLLMCYNLTNIKDVKTANSIFDIKDLKQYLITKKYPLPLDIALPVFSWYAWFSQGEFKGIVYPDEKNFLTADTRFFKKVGNNFLLTADTLAGNNYLREGDLLRLEDPGKDELAEAAEILHQHFPKTKRIALFYWDKFLIQRNEAVIHQIYATF